MSSQLFSPIALRGLALENRLVVAPMCQYTADDGSATDWHLTHLGMLANSGAGLLIVEATAVERRGRITHGCLGLYSDANEHALGRAIAVCRRYGTAKLGIQIGHAGRKASVTRPWEGKTMGDPLVNEAWPTRGPSAVPVGAGWHVPEAMSDADLASVKAAFVEAAIRADRLGFDLIETHGAHGYLLHQFLSPISNKRTDRYGGALENRMRFPLEVFAAVRAVWPDAKPAGMRISASDWLDGGWDLESSVVLAKELQARGCDFIDVSSGGTDPAARIPIGPGYQVPFAQAIKRATGMTTIAVGMITEAQQAETILADGSADMIALARGFLDDPHWGWHAAYALGAAPKLPPQYARSGLKSWQPAERHAAKR